MHPDCKCHRKCQTTYEQAQRDLYDCLLKHANENLMKKVRDGKKKQYGQKNVQKFSWNKYN